MTNWQGCRRLFVLLLVTAPLAVPVASQSTNRVEAYLSSALGFGGRDILRLRRGRLVSQLLDTPDRREIAVAGVLRVDLTSDDFVDATEDIETLLRGRTITQVRVLSDPPVAEDFTAVSLPQVDLEAVEGCSVGDCLVKLPGPAILRLNALDWSGAEPRHEVNEIFQATLLDYAARYWSGEPLPPYQDKSRSVDPIEPFGPLVRASPYLLAFVPPFRNHVARYPRGDLAGARDLLYWSEEQFGLKPVISLNHVSSFRATNSPRADAFVAVKQVYATHYFESAFGLLSYLAHPGQSGGYLVYIRHHRFDANLNPMQRRILEDRIEDYVADLLAEQSDRLMAGAGSG